MLTGAVGAALVGASTTHAPSAAAATSRPIWTLAWRDGELTWSAQARVSYTDPYRPGAVPTTYDSKVWSSGEIRPPFPFTELVPSWNIRTPVLTWAQVEVRVRTATAWSGWFVMGRWSDLDPALGGAIHRTSVAGQSSAIARVSTDTVVAMSGVRLVGYEVRVRLLRPVGTWAWPRATMVTVMASSLPSGPVSTSRTGVGAGVALPVPPLSQDVHRGHYPQFDGGGEAWCSPTTTAMLLRYWGVGPTPSQLSWVNPSVDADVDFAARSVYDYAYQGAGNWPFATGYAARFGLRSFVTRLRSLAEAEQFVARGIPLGASVAFASSELSGAGYSTAGHLLVISGFTATGDVICHDPAAHLIADNRQVRVVYDRGQFENVWVPRSGGLVYVMHPPAVELPAPLAAEPNWPGAQRRRDVPVRLRPPRPW